MTYEEAAGIYETALICLDGAASSLESAVEALEEYDHPLTKQARDILTEVASIRDSVLPPEDEPCWSGRR